MSKAVIALFLVLILATAQPGKNLICKGDFQSYQNFSSVNPFPYYNWAYKITRFVKDQCWFTPQPGESIQVNRIYYREQPATRLLYNSSMVEFNSIKWQKQYQLCQNVSLQVGKHYRFSFQQAMHPDSSSVNAISYLNNVIVKIVNVNYTVFPKLTAISYAFKATQVLNTVCGKVDTDVWKYKNFSKEGLSSFLDNFQLMELPPKNVTIYFEAEYNLASGNITLILVSPSFETSTLADMISNSQIEINGNNLNATYELLQGKYIKVNIKPNASLIINNFNYTLKTPLFNLSNFYSSNIIVVMNKLSNKFVVQDQNNKGSQFFYYFVENLLGYSLVLYDIMQMVFMSFFLSIFVYQFSIVGFYSTFTQPMVSSKLTLQAGSYIIKTQANFYNTLTYLLNGFQSELNPKDRQNQLKQIVLSINSQAATKYWYKLYQGFGGFLTNQNLNYLLSIILLAKIVICILIIIKKPKKKNQHSPSLIGLLNIFIVHLIFEASGMLISTYLNKYISNEQTQTQNKIHFITHIILFVGVLIVCIFYVKQIIQSESNPRLKMQTIFIMAQYSLLFILPVTFFFDSIYVTLAIGTIYSGLLAVLYFKSSADFSKQHKIMKMILLVTLVLYNLVYIFHQFIEKNNQSMNSNIAGAFIFLVNGILIILLIIQIILFYLSFVLAWLTKSKQEIGTDKNQIPRLSNSFQNRQLQDYNVQGVYNQTERQLKNSKKMFQTEAINERNQFGPLSTFYPNKTANQMRNSRFGANSQQKAASVKGSCVNPYFSSQANGKQAYGTTYQ